MPHSVVTKQTKLQYWFIGADNSVDYEVHTMEDNRHGFHEGRIGASHCSQTLMFGENSVWG